MRMILSGLMVAAMATFAGTAGAQDASIDVETVAPTIFKRQGEEIRVYSAKTICGLPGGIRNGSPELNGVFEPPVVPGLYLSAINVHNPDPTNAVTFTKRVVVALPERALEGDVLGEVSKTVEETLPAGRAFEVDCGDVFRLLEIDGGCNGDCPEPEQELVPIPIPRGFIKGFVVIETRGRPNAPPLQIVGVYTVGGGGIRELP